jgi:hypothetical protein
MRNPTGGACVDGRAHWGICVWEYIGGLERFAHEDDGDTDKNSDMAVPVRGDIFGLPRAVASVTAIVTT